jgi:hypothetical protein
MTISSESEVFQLVKADMERATDECRRLLEVEMFRSDPFLARIPIVPPTWQQRLRWKVLRIKNYFVTLGQALRGDDLQPPSDYDDW